MSTPQENAFLMHSQLEPELEDQGCGCFRSFRAFTHKHAPNDVDRVRLLPRDRREETESWVVRQVKKLREVSELVAGPKWKNFIRKMGSYFSDNKKRKDFQYDSFNYTLNFDDGNHDNDDQHGVNLGFSSRFAPPVLNDKPRSSTT